MVAAYLQISLDELVGVNTSSLDVNSLYRDLKAHAESLSKLRAVAEQQAAIAQRLRDAIRAAEATLASDLQPLGPASVPRRVKTRRVRTNPQR